MDPAKGAAVTQAGQRVRSRRSDAIRNEALVRAAAERMFLRQGGTISMEEVAAETGVSKGTVYNVYRSREEMVDQLAAMALKHVAAGYREAAADPDPWNALTRVILTPTLGLFATAELMDPAAPVTAARQALNEATASLEVLLNAAKTAGVVRPDIEIAHLTLLFRGLYAVLPKYSQRAPEEVLALAKIILQGIRA